MAKKVPVKSKPSFRVRLWIYAVAQSIILVSASVAVGLLTAGMNVPNSIVFYSSWAGTIAAVVGSVLLSYSAVKFFLLGK